mgnify:CR=1 FL=1
MAKEYKDLIVGLDIGTAKVMVVVAELLPDGAGAVVIEKSEDGGGVLATKLYTNGTNMEALYVPGLGFRRRPFIDHEQLDTYAYIPVMEGREVFKQAVSVGDLLSFYARVERIGNTSVTVHVEVYAERNPANLQVVKVTEAQLTYVAVDAEGGKREVPPEL